MLSKKEKTVKYTLVLNEDEAKWLRGLIQNPMCNPEDELEEDKEMRDKFWESLK